MKEMYKKVKKIIELTEELSSMLLSSLCFHETYRVFCEEYHMKPPYILGRNWLRGTQPYNLRMLCELVLLYDCDRFAEIFYDDKAKELADSVLKKMEAVKNMCEDTNAFFMLSVKNGFDARAAHNFDFGMLESELEMEPNERLALALRVPDPINKFVDIQRQMIGYITEYMFTDKDTIKVQCDDSNVKLIDFYRFFKSEEEANHMIQDIIRFGCELTEFIRVASL